MYPTSVSVSPEGLVEIRAYGGSRRERGAKIAAEVRRLRAEGREMKRYHRSYDEAYGFTTMSTAKYKG